MNAESSYFQSRFVFDPRRDIVWKEISAYLEQRHIPRRATILEIGAGHCHFINQVAASERHALDVSSEVRRYAAEGVIAHVQSCTSMETIRDGYFDTVFASNVFEHLTREQAIETLSEVKRVLKPNGKLIIIQPNFKHCYREYFDDYTHIQIYTDVSISDFLLASGFRVLDVKPRFLPFSMKSNLPKARWLVRLYLNSPVKPFAGQMLVVATK